MRFRACLLASAVLILVLVAPGRHSAFDSGAQPARVKRGGRLVISKSAAPTTFNRLFSADEPTSSITNCLVGHLIRINRQTQQPEAEIAQSWKITPDRKKVTFSLRPGVKFSDGHPATADDVVFTFQVITDPRVTTPVSDQFTFLGQRVRAEKIDQSTVAFIFPIAHPAALRSFDGVPILPRHMLEQAYREGRINRMWGLATPPEQVVGLGPFRLKSYVPGQTVVLQRNEHYWKKGATGDQLPYLDELVFVIATDRNAQLLKFRNGETDVLSPITADDLGSLSALERQGRIRIHDLGPSLIREIFWFNLNDGKQSTSGRSPVDPVKLGWFKEVKFRQAVSHAIDRQAIVNLVFAGKATPQWAFLSAGDRVWHNPAVAKYPYDQNRARQLLAEAGFVYRADRKALLDREGRPVGFSLMTNGGNAIRQKISAMIQEDLAKIGIRVSVGTMESNALVSRFNEGGEYEAGLLAVVSGDFEPSSNLNVLLSKGGMHWWYPKQVRAATAWEARIDQLMTQQMTTINQAARKKIIDEVQKILAEQQPFIFLVSRHLMVAAKRDIGNLRPSLLPDFVLWNVEELYRG